MNNAQFVYSNAELAFAAYVTLDRGLTSAQTTSLQGQGFTAKQADEFAKRYPEIVIPSFHDPVSDFDVNVFKDANGQVAVAIRGNK